MNSNAREIVITSLGAITPVGATADESCAAITAGISSISEHAYFSCAPNDPDWDDDLVLYASTVPTVDPYLDGLERFIALAVPPLLEVLGNADLTRSALNETGLYIALPSEDAATFNLRLYSHFLPELCRATGLGGLKSSKINKSGNTGFGSHLLEAKQLLQSGDLSYCIVGGIDSYLLEDRLQLMDEKWRVRSERNVDGLIPGEAGTMVLLETLDHAEARGIKPIARLLSIASAQETETFHSERNSTGQGLSNAIREVVNGAATDQFESVYCNLNGESYFAYEWGIQLVRLHQAFQGLKNLYHPIEFCGDMGAATAGILLALASKQHQKQSGRKVRPSLIWLSSDGPDRIALSLGSI